MVSANTVRFRGRLFFLSVVFVSVVVFLSVQRGNNVSHLRDEIQDDFRMVKESVSKYEDTLANEKSSIHTMDVEPAKPEPTLKVEREPEQKPSSHHCNVQLAPPNTFKPVALVSQPGSGNTWLRHLLEQATGYYTGSVFHDSNLYEKGYIGEFEDKSTGTTFTVKTHSPGSKSQFADYKAAILLLRSPFDVILTERNRRASKDHVGIATWQASLRSNAEFLDLVESIISGYERRVYNWLNISELPMLVVHYENIKKDPVAVIQKIAAFLDFPLEEKRLDCVIENMEGSFHRNDTDREKAYHAFSSKTKYDILLAMNRVAAMLPDTSPLPWEHALSPYLGNIPNVSINEPSHTPSKHPQFHIIRRTTK